MKDNGAYYTVYKGEHVTINIQPNGPGAYGYAAKRDNDVPSPLNFIITRDPGGEHLVLVRYFFQTPNDGSFYKATINGDAVDTDSPFYDNVDSSEYTPPEPVERSYPFHVVPKP